MSYYPIILSNFITGGNDHEVRRESHPPVLTAVIGAGGHGKVVLDAVLSAGVHLVAGIVDDNIELAGTRLFDVPIVGSMTEIKGVQGYIVAIGDNRTRREKYNLHLQAGYTPVTVIHPSAIISPSVRIGKGTTVLANVVINPDASIGDNVVLYTSCTIDHECDISDHSYISPGCNICGRVRIGVGAMLGAGAVVLPGLSIGQWTIVGAGAVVTDDVPGNVTVVGVPARIIG
jgi:sugar O-acyltransferase (sialic acid O-acetyltransferase NeuD family)